jgi:hypothetical protein
MVAPAVLHRNAKGTHEFLESISDHFHGGSDHTHRLRIRQFFIDARDGSANPTD